MENEIWKPIVKPIDFSSKFEISSLGRFRRSEYTNKNGKFYPAKIYTLSKKQRYLKIGLSYKGKVLNTSIHRLVCYAFLDNPENKPQVNHKNANKHDNRIENLEWCTQSENICHAQSLGIMKYAKPKPPKKQRGRKNGEAGISKKIIDIETKIIYNSVQEVSKISGIKLRSLRRMVSGERINHTSYRYLTKNGIKTDVKLPPPPKPVKIKPPKVIRIPKKYIPHPKETKKLVMYDLVGNKVQIFDSVRIASNYMKSNNETFRKQIKRSPIGYYKGYIFKYA